MRQMRQATAWPKARNARSWYGTLMGHMRHSTGRADRQDKRAFEQFGLSEGVRRLKANCIEGFGRYAQEGHIGEDRNNRQGNLLRDQPQRAHKGLKGLMKRSGCKGLTKGSKGSSPGTRV